MELEVDCQSASSSISMHFIQALKNQIVQIHKTINNMNDEGSVVVALVDSF